MRKSSHSPGCMRRLPASHSCHPRRVQLISAAAAVCESPAASRAARTSAGAGFAEGPFVPRFGWLGIYFFSDDFGRLFKLRLHVGFALVASHLRGEIAGFLGGGGFDKAEFARICSYVKGGHFWLQPQYPRRGGQQRAAHELYCPAGPSVRPARQTAQRSFFGLMRQPLAGLARQTDQALR